jgi:hypothetical protein
MRDCRRRVTCHRSVFCSPVVVGQDQDLVPDYRLFV